MKLAESSETGRMGRGMWGAVGLAIAVIIVVSAVGLEAQSGTHQSVPTSSSSSFHSQITSQSSTTISSALPTISSNGTCTQDFNSVYPGLGNTTLKVLEGHVGPRNQSNPMQGAGPGDVWCIYGKSDNLENIYPSSRILSGVAASSDGSSVVATGFQILPGPAGVYANGLACLFDNRGQMVWNLTSSQPFFSLQANANNSAIVIDNPGLVYVDGFGRILWNYSQFQPTSVVLLKNGSDVVAGIDQVPYPNDVLGSALTMFDSTGRVVWNVTLPQWIFDSSDSLAYSAGYLAAGLSGGPTGGALSYYDLNGSLIWSRPVNTAIQQVSFQNGGSTIFVSANGLDLTYDLRGDLLTNQTAPPQG